MTAAEPFHVLRCNGKVQHEAHILLGQRLHTVQFLRHAEHFCIFQPFIRQFMHGIQRIHKCPAQRFDVLCLPQTGEPVAWNPLHSVQTACQTACYRRNGVGVVAQIDSLQHTVAVIVRIQHAPQRGFQRIHHIAAAPDFILRRSGKIHDGGAVQNPRIAAQFLGKRRGCFVILLRPVDARLNARDAPAVAQLHQNQRIDAAAHLRPGMAVRQRGNVVNDRQLLIRGQIGSSKFAE